MNQCLNVVNTVEMSTLTLGLPGHALTGLSLVTLRRCNAAQTSLVTGLQSIHEEYHIEGEVCRTIV